VTNLTRRRRLRDLDALLEHIELANLSDSVLSDDVARVLAEAGVERPHALSPVQRCEAVWALQLPYLALEACVNCGRLTGRADEDDQPDCGRHDRWKRRPMGEEYGPNV
jgi:hypothetical protein